MVSGMLANCFLFCLIKEGEEYLKKQKVENDAEPAEEVKA